MNNLFKTIIFFSLIFLFSGCSLLNNDDDKTKTPGGGDNSGPVNDVDYTNYRSSVDGASITVDNTTSKNLVAFKGTIRPTTMIGGVRAYDSNWGLKKDTNLFSQTGDFILILVTEEDYLANKDNLNALESKPFTRIYAFYNASGTNNNIYKISGALGGDRRIILNNSTSFNVELRRDGIHGEALGYAASGMLNTTLYVNNGDYAIFPVFRKFNSAQSEIISVYPRYNSGSLEGKARFREFSLTASEPEQSFNMGDFLQDIEFSTGAAYLIIDNQTSGVGLRVREGNADQITSTGVKVINAGRENTFQINMGEKPGESSEYLDSRTINTYSIGPSINFKQLPSFNFESDKIYKVIVTGADESTISLGTITEVGTVDFNTL